MRVLGELVGENYMNYISGFWTVLGLVLPGLCTAGSEVRRSPAKVCTAGAYSCMCVAKSEVWCHWTDCVWLGVRDVAVWSWGSVAWCAAICTSGV